MNSIDKVNVISNLFPAEASKANKKKNAPGPKDSIEISNTSKVYSNVEKFLNLGNPDRLDLSKMNKGEKEEFIKMVASLAKKGIVGYEELEVNKQKEKHFIETEIGDERIKGAKLYKDREIKSRETDR
jgi:hypothetical protein